MLHDSHSTDFVGCVGGARAAAGVSPLPAWLDKARVCMSEQSRARPGQTGLDRAGFVGRSWQNDATPERQGRAT